MFNDTINFRLLNLAAVLAGLASAGLVVGRAWLGILLALSLILVLVASDNRKNHREIISALPKPLIWLLAVTMAATAVNIPFSLRIDLSWEAWARSWALLGAISYLAYGLKNHISLLIKSCVISIFLVLAFGLTPLLYISKSMISGVLFAIPLCFLILSRTKSRVWLIFCLINIPLYIGCTLNASAKASLAGLLLIGLTSLAVYSLARFNLLKTLVCVGAVLIPVVIALVWWLPDQLNASSTLNVQMAPLPIWLIDFHRQLIWMFSFDLFQHSPWVGFGLNASNYHPMAQVSVVDHFGADYAGLPDISNAPVFPAHAHNWIIEILLDGGIVALVPVLACVGLLFLHAIHTYFRAPNSALLLFIAINSGYWGTGLLNFSFWSVWWQTLYFLASAICLVQWYTEREEV